MGSYKQTCAITHLPIREGDEVVGLVLATARKPDLEWNGSAGGTGSFHRIASLPFHAVYGDELEITRSEAADAVATSMGGKPIAEQLRIMDESGEAGTYEGDGVCVVLVHAGAWEALSSVRRGSTGERGAPSDEIDPIAKLLSLWTRPDDEPDPDDVSELTPRRSKKAKGQDGWFFGTAMLDWRWENTYPDDTCPLAARALSIRSQLGLHPWLARQVQKAVANKLDAGDPAGARELLGECGRLVAADLGMHMLRRHWSPQIGVGSQDLHSTIQVEVAEWTLGMARAIAAEDVLLEDVEPSGPRP